MAQQLADKKTADQNPFDKRCRQFGDFDVDHYTSAPLQLIQYALIPKNQAEVFALVSHHEGMAAFSFALSKVEIRVEDSSTTSQIRLCKTPVGFVLKEAIVHFQPPRMYAYRILNAAALLPNHLGVVHIEHLADQQSILVWRNYFTGQAIGGVFARISLGAIIPDMVSNMAAHFGGRILSTAELSSLLMSQQQVV